MKKKFNWKKIIFDSIKSFLLQLPKKLFFKQSEKNWFSTCFKGIMRASLSMAKPVLEKPTQWWEKMKDSCRDHFCKFLDKCKTPPNQNIQSPVHTSKYTMSKWLTYLRWKRKKNWTFDRIWKKEFIFKI